MKHVPACPANGLLAAALVFSSLLSAPALHAQQSSVAEDQSVARQWNEAQIEAIRLDVPRPTVHARNLFHVAAVMYDSWAAYDDVAQPFLLGNAYGSAFCEFNGVALPADVEAARNEAVSFAAYRMLSHRFALSPNAATSQAEFDALMADLGYDPAITSLDYENGGPAELGNYAAQCMIDAGLADGSNEANNYATLNYTTANAPLVVGLSGNPTLTDVNRWQPLVLDFTVDANGEVVPGNTPGFLSPEWGQVTPFALTPDDLTIFKRDGVDYWVYHDPGAPPQLELGTGAGGSRDYIWNFALVAVWSSHLDPDNETMIDISPASRGNTPVSEFPTTAEEYVEFYDLLNGGITGSQGHAINPFTGEVYEPQLVRMGDYGRVLAEFWADGPRSETPPGHWFTIFNEVSDHEALVKRFGGTGDVMSDLAWDVHGYFLLGASFHDVAISVWGIKSWYDYIRPVSAIRSLASRGQSSDPNLPSYSPDGIMLIDGHIEVVQEGDELAGANNENVGKIKLNAWRGPAYVADAETDHAGVGWILADDWWPYQQPSFVTPPFAGYVSGHSTFSRAASEILTMFTGSEYFPGGIGEFSFTHDEYLAFENGPSTDITLQWATYRDASDETSLSRIWGGIHPPIDDIPGRLIGIDVANDVFAKASAIFEGVVTGTEDAAVPGAGFAVEVYPNPVGISRSFHLAIDQAQVHRELEVEVYNALGQQVYRDAIASPNQTVSLDERRVSPGVYLVRVTDGTTAVTRKLIVL